jgi:hypothetical protein
VEYTVVVGDGLAVVGVLVVVTALVEKVVDCVCLVVSEVEKAVNAAVELDAVDFDIVGTVLSTVEESVDVSVGS